MCGIFMSPFREGTAVRDGRKEGDAREWGAHVKESEAGSKRSEEARGRGKEGTEVEG